MQGIKPPTLVGWGVTVALVVATTLYALAIGGAEGLALALRYTPGMGVITAVLLVPRRRSAPRRLLLFAFVGGGAVSALASSLERPMPADNLTQLVTALVHFAFVEQTMCGSVLCAIWILYRGPIDVLDWVKYAVIVAAGFAFGGHSLPHGGWTNCLLWLVAWVVGSCELAIAVTIVALGCWAATVARSVWLRVVAVVTGLLAAIAINALSDYGWIVRPHLAITDTAQIVMIVACAAGAYAIQRRDRLLVSPEMLGEGSEPPRSLCRRAW
jgi:hypothetical protein